MVLFWILSPSCSDCHA